MRLLLIAILVGLTLPVSAAECQKVEYAELKDWKAEELVAKYCADKIDHLAFETSQKSRERAADSSTGVEAENFYRRARELANSAKVCAYELDRTKRIFGQKANDDIEIRCQSKVGTPTPSKS